MRPNQLVLAIVVLALVGCGKEAAPDEGDAVARVGDAMLTQTELADAMGGAMAELDSASAREQVIEQWIQRELLVQEARAQGLDGKPAVRRAIDESARATLEAAAVDHYFETHPVTPSANEIEDYYQRNASDLALREPYVQVRLLRTNSTDRAALAQAALSRAASMPQADSLFKLIATEYADDPRGAIALAREYMPESSLQGINDALGSRVQSLRPNGPAASVGTERHTYVVQLIDRIPAGTVPPLEVLRSELSERLTIQLRRDSEARLLQRLRSEALAANRIEIK